VRRPGFCRSRCGAPVPDADGPAAERAPHRPGGAQHPRSAPGAPNEKRRRAGGRRRRGHRQRVSRRHAQPRRGGPSRGRPAHHRRVFGSRSTRCPRTRGTCGRTARPWRRRVALVLGSHGLERVERAHGDGHRRRTRWGHCRHPYLCQRSRNAPRLPGPIDDQPDLVPGPHLHRQARHHHARHHQPPADRGAVARRIRRPRVQRSATHRVGRMHQPHGDGSDESVGRWRRPGRHELLHDGFRRLPRHGVRATLVRQGARGRARCGRGMALVRGPVPQRRRAPRDAYGSRSTPPSSNSRNTRPYAAPLAPNDARSKRATWFAIHSMRPICSTSRSPSGHASHRS